MRAAIVGKSLQDLCVAQEAAAVQNRAFIISLMHIRTAG